MWRGTLFVCSLCACLLQGCMTHALWTGQLTETFNSPSSPTHLAVFDVPERGDLLVQYDELGPWNDRPRVRQYFVKENAERLQSGKTPIFVPGVPVEAIPLPVSTNSSVPPAGTWAESSANGTTFFIHREGTKGEGPFVLPTYRGASGRAKVFLMTPLTGAVDSTVIGGVLACDFVVGQCTSGGHTWVP
jgi:hypothetical protein